MTRIALSTFSVFALVPGSAHAFDWNGYYGGLNLGGAFLEGRITASRPGLVTTKSMDDSSVTFGGQLGWNLQAGEFLLGVEGDFNYLDLKDNHLVAPATKSTTAVRADYDWFATIRGRAGLVFNDTTLVYATGGLALLDAGMTMNRTVAAVALAPISDSFVHVGFAVGGGVEHSFAADWTVKIEYLYAEFGPKRINAPGAFVRAQPQIHVIRAGANWHF